VCWGDFVFFFYIYLFLFFVGGGGGYISVYVQHILSVCLSIFPSSVHSALYLQNTHKKEDCSKNIHLCKTNP